MSGKRRIDLTITKWRSWAGGSDGSPVKVRWLVVICLVALLVGMPTLAMAACDDWLTDPNEMALPGGTCSSATGTAATDSWATDPNEIAGFSHGSATTVSADGSDSGFYVTDPGELAVASYHSGALASASGPEPGDLVLDPGEVAAVSYGSGSAASTAGRDSGVYVTDPTELAVVPFGPGAVASVTGADAFVIDPGEQAVVAYTSSAAAGRVELEADPVAGASSLAEARFILASGGQGALSGMVDEMACSIC